MQEWPTYDAVSQEKIKNLIHNSDNIFPSTSVEIPISNDLLINESSSNIDKLSVLQEYVYQFKINYVNSIAKNYVDNAGFDINLIKNDLITLYFSGYNIFTLFSIITFIIILVSLFFIYKNNKKIQSKYLDNDYYLGDKIKSGIFFLLLVPIALNFYLLFISGINVNETRKESHLFQLNKIHEQTLNNFEIAKNDKFVKEFLIANTNKIINSQSYKVYTNRMDYDIIKYNVYEQYNPYVSAFYNSYIVLPSSFSFLQYDAFNTLDKQYNSDTIIASFCNFHNELNQKIKFGEINSEKIKFDLKLNNKPLKIHQCDMQKFPVYAPYILKKYSLDKNWF